MSTQETSTVGCIFEGGGSLLSSLGGTTRYVSRTVGYLRIRVRGPLSGCSRTSGPG